VRAHAKYNAVVAETPHQRIT